MSSFNLHNDTDLFREAVSITVAQTKFLPRLIEKDYFCSLLLEYFLPLQELVFKGGTCLAKVHTNFYRLSEDLDFTIPTAIDSDRKTRRKAIEPVKALFDDLEKELTVFKYDKTLEGANMSTQYIAYLTYDSIIASNTETIKVEISLREPLIEEVVYFDTYTILLNPVDSKQYFSPLHFLCISKQEAYAEKFRAAITRRDPAIRDYFDIDYAIRNLAINPVVENFISLVERKLAVPGNSIINDFAGQKQVLDKQLETELKPVLRSEDYNNFDLNRAYNFVSEMYGRISKPS